MKKEVSSNEAKLIRENNILKEEITRLRLKSKLLMSSISCVIEQNEKDYYNLINRYPILERPINPEDFSIRTYNVLMSFGISTIWELVQYSRLDLKKFRLMGDKSLEEIEQFVYKNNLWLGMTPRISIDLK